MDALIQNWAELPVHIVDLIVTKIVDFSDYFRFCGACPEWRSAAHEVNPDYKVKTEILVLSRKKLPMLMFLTNGGNTESRSLFDVSNRKTYQIKLPLPFKYRFVGSSHGWLLCLGKDMVLTLVNPCNNACVSLPVFKFGPPDSIRHRRRFFDYHIRKGILVSYPDSSPNCFEVAVIYGGAFELAFFKPEEASWNSVDIGMSLDIIFHKGKLYAINAAYRLIEIDTTCKTFKTIIPPITDYERQYEWPRNVYLVESQDGELLLIKRLYAPFEESYAENYVEAGDLDEGNGADYQVESGGNCVELEMGDLDEDNGAEYQVESGGLDGENDKDYRVEVEDFDNEYGVDDVAEVEDLDDENDVYNHVEFGESDYISDRSELDSSDYQKIYDFAEDDEFPLTVDFKVYKMKHSPDDGSASWVEMDNIGEQALFLGDNQSVSVSTIEFPKCMKNSIYFTTEHHRRNYPYASLGVNREDGYIFNLEDKTLHYHHVLEDDRKYMLPPIWFVLNPQQLNSGC